LKNLSFLDIARLDEFFDHTGRKGYSGEGLTEVSDEKNLF
jgi:hypothetical protein